jgi:serine protease Do
VTTTDLLDAFDYGESCTFDNRYEYPDPVYTGFYDLWTNCDGTGTLLVVLGVEPEDGSYLALVVVQVVSEADLDALDRIMDSFIFIP